jgi:hypothetical protein
MLADDDTRRYTALNGEEAHRQGLIDEAMLETLVNLKKQRLSTFGFVDLRPKPDHLLVSFDPAGAMLRDSEGKPDIRLCNFELIRKARGSVLSVRD